MRKPMVFLLVMAMAGLCANSFAGVPQMINYQGELTDDTGTPLDTTVSITFTIYDDATGGNPLWTETHPSITTSSGRFNVMLGTMVPITDNIFAEAQRWLGITIEADPEITPRTEFLTAPYAFRVSTVDGATGGIMTGDFEISGEEGAVEKDAEYHPGMPKVRIGTGFGVYGAGRAGSLHMMDGVGGIGVDLDGQTASVGIGTSSMAANLHVNGTIYTLGGNGDANLDGFYTLADAVMLTQYLSGTVTLTDQQYAESDIDGDGRVNWDDVTILLRMIYYAEPKSQALWKVHSIYGAAPTGSANESFYVRTSLGVGSDAPTEKVYVEWATGVDAEMGRGTSDPDITYLALRNANGTRCYIYPDAAGTGIVVTTTHP